MDIYELSARTYKGGTSLTRDDIQNIITDINEGKSYNYVQKKYKIGSNRLSTILKLNNCQSTLLNKNKLELKEKCIEYKPVYDVSPLDDLLEKKTKEMKERIDNMKLHSFL